MPTAHAGGHRDVARRNRSSAGGSLVSTALRSTRSAAAPIVNALTIDVEEQFQVHNFEGVIPRSSWERYPSRVVPNTRRILELLSAHGTHATFFVLGWIAERHPELVRQIADAGHELGTHGYAHELIYRQTPEVFEDDVRRSLGALRAAFTMVSREPPPIRGYRAPAFSITRQSLWALDVLKRLGVEYDSSIFPLVAHDRYGIGDASRFASEVKSGLWEFPVSTVRLLGRNLPVAGGGYFRLYPAWLTHRAIRRINVEGHPAVVYLHPWEFDPDPPRVDNARPLARFRNYVNIHKTASNLGKLMQSGLRFAPMGHVFDRYLKPAPSERPS
jgi:polysaccharide deacetylase family protein (PEP-CTERM system associated)